jgi:hypothetical protein
VYVIDTSSLIDLGLHYPRDTFPSVWSNVEAAIGRGTLLSPREVLRELEKGDDQLVRWAKRQRGFFVPVNRLQTVKIKEIQKKFPKITDNMALGPCADPWLVALATVLSGPLAAWSVVTKERMAGLGSHRVPNVCAAFEITSLNLLDFFRAEGFKF